MFKFFGYALLLVSLFWLVALFTISYSPSNPSILGAMIAAVALWAWIGGAPLMLLAGILLCIHKYLHRDDAARPDYYYEPQPLPRTSLPSQPANGTATEQQGSASPRQMPMSQFGR